LGLQICVREFVGDQDPLKPDDPRVLSG